MSHKITRLTKHLIESHLGQRCATYLAIGANPIRMLQAKKQCLSKESHSIAKVIKKYSQL
jgi:hypothetical protein